MIQILILLPVIILFFANGCGQLYYAIKLNKKFPEEHSFINSIITVLLWITAGILYPFYFSMDSSEILLFKALSAFFICIFTPILISAILIYQYYFVLKRNPSIKREKTIENFLQNYENNNEIIKNNSHSLKIDIRRKALHLFPAGVIIILWIFSIYIWGGLWNADDFWGISRKQFARFLIITSGYSGVLIFAALDYLRLSYIFEKKDFFYLIPSNVFNVLARSLKRREVFEFTKPVSLVLAFTPIFLFPFGIFSAAALISTIGDGAASLFGLKYGKKRFPKNSNKTRIGYIAGFIASFLVSFLSIFSFMSFIHILKLTLISLGGAGAFIIIDVANSKIDDNILNPLITGCCMALLYYLL
jgi:dolichol kinase